jgi:sugar phosphate isomerase/epimerase
MKIAVQENLLPGGDFQEKLLNAERFGFEGVEVWGRELSERAEDIKSSLGTARIGISTVCAGYPGDLLGPDRKARETAIQGIKDLLRICADLGGVGVITVPTFRGPKIPDLYPWRPDVREVEKQILIEECRVLGDYAEDVDCYVILEPINRYETHFMNTLSLAVELCRAIDREKVKMMADFFHMNIEEADISASLEEASEYLVHIHLADSNRMVPGRGHTDFEGPFKTLKRINYRNFMAFECRVPGDPFATLPNAVKYLRRFM